MTERLAKTPTTAGLGCPVRAVRLPSGTATSWSRAIRRLVGAVALAPVVLVAGALSACTPTPGGTASVTSFGFGNTLHFDAVGGRNNSITVSLGTPSGGVPTSLLLTDSRNPVTPGTGCTRVNDNTVRCSYTPFFGAPLQFDHQLIRLGDGGDTFTSSVALPGFTLVHAGAGDDTLSGGPSSDTFFEDSDGLDHDSFTGGAGADAVHYAGIRHAVSITLNDVADDGRPGEGDNVKIDIEVITGTGFADTLTGNGQRNFLGALNQTNYGLEDDQYSTYPWSEMTGGAAIDGAGGDDSIEGADHDLGDPDRLSGGTGNDTVAGHSRNDVIKGGEGDDTLLGGDGFDALDGGTETDYCDPGPGGGTTVNCETGP